MYKRQLRDYTERVTSGEIAFSTLARLYSEDEGSRRRGGELGFMGRAEPVSYTHLMSFIADKIVMDGLTYDDVLLIPAYSEVLPKTGELTTKVSRNIELKVPFVTAAMDTVTEAKMAIAIAREGGIGVIHKNMSIEEQARQVAIVKRAENGMIYDPVTIKRGSTVRDALALMSEYRIGGIPVVDDERYLVGIVLSLIHILWCL